MSKDDCGITDVIEACAQDSKEVRKSLGTQTIFRFSFPSVVVRKRCKNASVDADLFICFRDTKNGVIQKLISADRAQMAQSENQIFYRKIRI